MIDVRKLPDAWDTFYRLLGKEGLEGEGLNDIYYRLSTAIFDYRISENLSQTKLRCV